MIAKCSKLLLPAIVCAVSTCAVLSAPKDVLANGGSITVCKIIADQNGNIVDGSQMPGTQFAISGISPAQASQGTPAGQIGTSNFNSPLSFNSDILTTVAGNDAQCTTYSNLDLGTYYWGEESINPSSGWAAPLYNDQHLTPVASIADFYTYDGNIFDGDSSNDPSRNTNSDGHIILHDARPNRTLVVLNRYLAQGGTPNNPNTPNTPSGDQKSSCPVDNKAQKVDQVWFSDIGPNNLTVNWANKGDVQGYHIVYSLQPNNWLWGVKVGNVSSFTLNNLPTTNIYVSIIPLAANDCAGIASDPATPQNAVGGASDVVEKPQTLAATGVAEKIMLLLFGSGLLILGLCRTISARPKKSI